MRWRANVICLSLVCVKQEGNIFLLLKMELQNMLSLQVHCERHLNLMISMLEGILYCE